MCALLVSSTKFSRMAGSSQFSRLRKEAWCHSRDMKWCQELSKCFGRGSLPQNDQSEPAVSPSVLQAVGQQIEDTSHCVPYRGTEKRRGRLLLKREGNQQDTCFLQTRIIVSLLFWLFVLGNFYEFIWVKLTIWGAISQVLQCLLLMRLSYLLAILKPELQGQTHGGTREQTKPLLVHRTPILY